VLLADLVYDVPANVILDSARRALTGFDVITSCIKAWVFGLIISTVSATRRRLCKNAFQRILAPQVTPPSYRLCTVRLPKLCRAFLPLQ
jgi:hypothetical protein